MTSRSPGSVRRAWARAGAVLASAGLMFAAPQFASPVRAATASDTPVSVTVDSVSPNTPARSTTKQPIQFTLDVTNTGQDDLTGLSVTAQRGDPVTTQAELGKVTLAPTSPADDDPVIPPTRAVKLSLSAGSTAQVTFTTTTNVPQDAGICLCADAVYPIYFLVHQIQGGTDRVIGHGGTYLPVTKDAVHRLQVGWLWPVLDRPHRLLSDTVFEDDELAGELTPGGRLANILSVVEQVGPDVPVTLVVDPEIIDEVAVMAAGSYRVRATDSTTVAGAGSAAAAAWLSRLHDVLSGDPLVDIATTPYGDPDVQSIAGHGRGWSTGMPAAMSARVRRALDGRTPQTTLSWPAAPRLSSATLRALIERGASQVVLADTAVRTATPSDQPVPGTVALRSGSRSVTALVTTSRLSSLVAQAVVTDGGGRVLPRLLAELSVRVTSNDVAGQQVLLAAPRYVDPDVDSAVATIRGSTSSVYTSAVAVSDIHPTAVDGANTAALRSGASSRGLPPVVFDALRAVRISTPTLAALLADSGGTSTSPAAQTLLDSLPVAAQRLESSAFRLSGGESAMTGSEYAEQLSDLLDQLRNGVHIVPPSATGSYTLASGNSALPVTVTNDLDYPATVEVRISAINGLPGLITHDASTHRIAANSKVILHIPASLERSGRIRVQAELTATNGASLGSPISLTLRNTALGKVGIYIMTIAGGLLVLALGRRWIVSMGRRRNPRPVVIATGEFE